MKIIFDTRGAKNNSGFADVVFEQDGERFAMKLKRIDERWEPMDFAPLSQRDDELLDRIQREVIAEYENAM